MNETKSILLRYLGQAIIIFCLFKYVPKNPMAASDILLTTIIVLLVYAVFENVYKYYANSDQSAKCVEECEKFSEQMTSLPQLPAPSTTQSSTPQSSTTPQSSSTTPPPYTYVPVNVAQASPTTTQTYLKQVDTNIRSINQSNSYNSQQPNIPSQQMPDGIQKNPDGSYTYSKKVNPQAISVGSRQIDDVISNESKYSYIDFNSMPVGNTAGTFEYGYSFMPPENWYPVPPHPPVCVTEKTCPVCPVYTNGTNIELKDWNDCRRISPPDNINVDYVTQKLNSGR